LLRRFSVRNCRRLNPWLWHLMVYQFQMMHPLLAF
jgi:hypothetical protein